MTSGSTLNMTRTVRIGAMGAAIFVFCWLAYPSLTSNPGPFLEDDSYFYAQIAYNLGVHHHSSFDMLHPTDGYHLLWGGVLAATTWVVSFVTLDKALHLTVMLSVYVGVVVLVTALFGRTLLERAVMTIVGLSCAWLMEAAVLTLLLLTVLSYVLDRRSVDRTVCFALLLIPLARIDATVIAAVWLLKPVLDRQWSEAWRLSACLAAGIVLHFAIMYGVHGHLTSVSFELKASEPFDLGRNLMTNVFSVTMIRRSVLVGAFFVLAVWVWLTSGRGRDAVIGIVAPTLFIAGHTALNADVKSWYTVPILQCYVFIAFTLATTAWARWIPRAAFAAFCVYYVSSRFYLLNLNREVASATVAFVNDLKGLVPSEQPVFHVDGGGYVGFMAERHVINGDGLVNSHEYAQGRRERTLQNYLHDNGVRYVVTNSPRRGLEASLARYGGMKVESSRLLLESVAVDRPGNVYWAYRLYEVR
jgi:hypothetical protein